MRGHEPGTHMMGVRHKDAGRIGAVEYEPGEDKQGKYLNIWHIDSHVPHSGAATRLMDELGRRYPEHHPDPLNLTDEGHRFWQRYFGQHEASRHTAAVDLPPGYALRTREEEKTQRWGLPALHVDVRHDGQQVGSLSVHQRQDATTGGALVGHPNIYVDPEHQRKGLGTALYAEVHRRWPDVPVVHSPHASDDARALNETLRDRFPDRHHASAGKPYWAMSKDEYEAAPGPGRRWVYHASEDPHAFDDGVHMDRVPNNLARQRYEHGEHAEYAPGNGLGRGVYVGGEAHGVDGYGHFLHAFKVPTSHLAVPPEAQGYRPDDIEHHLKDHNGALLTHDVAPEDVVNLGRIRNNGFTGHQVHQLNALRAGQSVPEEHLDGKVRDYRDRWLKSEASRQSENIEEYRLNRHVQDRRAEEYSKGHQTETDEFYGRGGHGGQEKSLTLKDWLRQTKQPTLEDQPPEFQEHWRGYELGHAHGLKGRVDAEEVDREHGRSSHPDHFLQGYGDGLGHAMDAQDRVAVLVGGKATAPAFVSLMKVAHVSGNTVDALHCPFCGSGSVTARSDGSIECFSGDTRYMTFDGIKTFAETVGTTQKVLAHGTAGGDWVDGEIRAFGEQPLRAVTLRRNKQLRVVYATGGHGWFYRNGHGGPLQEATTDELKPGMALEAVVPTSRISRSFPSIFGIAHGVVFGDGGITGSQAQVQLWGEKDEQLLQYFPGQPASPMKLESGVTGMQVRGLPRYFKDLPTLGEATPYLYGWLAGYFAADGSVTKTGQVRLSSARRDHLEFVQVLCGQLGIGTYGVSVESRIGRSGKQLADEPTDLFTLELLASTLDPEFFLIAEHRARFEAKISRGFAERLRWTVVAVGETDRVEEVYCAVVPGKHTFALEFHTLVRNCGFCTAAYTVQVQPQFSAFPQSVDGAQYPWPGRDDMGMGPGGGPVPPGAAGEAVPGEDPDEEGGGGPPWAQGGAQGDDGPPGDDDEEEDDEDPEASVGGAKAPPFGKKSYRTSFGGTVVFDDYLDHLILTTAADQRRTAAIIKAERPRKAG